MSDSGTNAWRQMLFAAPESRRESLWVEELSGGTYRLLSVPVWAYGLSVGTVVAAEQPGADPLRFAYVLRPSGGGTIRFIAPQGNLASELYKSRIVPDARRLGLFIGPATFFDPRLVAVHVRDRATWWPEVGGYFDRLVTEGVVEGWEVGDPDEYAADHADDSELSAKTRDVLVHPLPIDGQMERHVN